MEVALFGTSADPPTIAHQKIIGYLASKYNFVGVWAADNPFKSHGASLEQRQKMLELLVDDLLLIYPRIVVDRELSYRRTFDTVNYAQNRWLNANFTLVIGADLVHQLSTWYRANELLSQVSLLIIPRNGYQMPSLDDLQLLNLSTKITIAPVNTPPVSSTNIRQNQGEGLTPKVSTYIKANQLYQTLLAN
jgi:nicotinate-nucleotide adenylyltransferase